MKTEFGKYLEKFMQRNGYTLEYISKETEASISIVGHYRKGIRIPKDDFVEKFINKFIKNEKEGNHIKYLVAYDRTPDLIKKDLEYKDNIIEMPLVGKAAAGKGYLNYEEHGYNNEILSTYLVEVSGDSMFPTLCDGDHIVVDSQIKSLNSIDGKICVLTYHDQTYVKRIKLESKKVILKSDNSNKKDFADIVIQNDEVEFLKLEGLVVESRRKH